MLRAVALGRAIGGAVDDAIPRYGGLVSTEVWAAIIGAAIGGILGLAGGVWGAAYNHDRELAIRQRNIALALCEDIRRIRSFIMPSGNEIAIVYDEVGRALSPDVHPWLQPFVVELASVSAEIVGGLLRLQDRLMRRRHLIDRYRSSIDAAISATKEARGARFIEVHLSLQGKTVQTPSVAKLLEDLDTATTEEKRAGELFDHLETRIRFELDLLEAQVTKVAKRPILPRWPQPQNGNAQDWS
jgi:hypothetical protein